MYRVPGEDKYTLDHDVKGWMVISKFSIVMPAGTLVQIVDETEDERGQAVIFVPLDSEGSPFTFDIAADADDFWDVEEVE